MSYETSSNESSTESPRPSVRPSEDNGQDATMSQMQNASEGVSECMSEAVIEPINEVNELNEVRAEDVAEVNEDGNEMEEEYVDDKNGDDKNGEVNGGNEDGGEEVDEESNEGKGKDKGEEEGTIPVDMSELAFWEYLAQHSNKLMSIMKQEEEWKELESRTKWQEEQIQRLSEENRELRARLAITEGCRTRTQLAVEKLEEKMTDTVTRSMRDNVILKNMAEEEGEDDEKIERKVLHFFANDLNIPSAEMNKIKIERSHRMTKKNKDQVRNIVVKLNSKGKSVVMRNLKNLQRNSTIKVTEQFPPEVQEGRNKLWPVFVSAKQEGKPVRWKQDSLQIDGKIIKPPTDHNRNINIDTTEVAMGLRVKHTAVVNRDNSQFQGHTVKISSLDDVTPAIKALCADPTVAGASHLMYAYRVGNSRYSVQNWKDDGEWGSARWIMDTVQKKDMYGYLVCITRWCSGQHVGRARMGTIRDITEQAIQDID